MDGVAISWTYTLGDAPILPPTPDPGAPPDVEGYGGQPDRELLYTVLETDPATGDAVIPFRWLRGAPAVVQRIRTRFQFWRREWFLDQRIGVPYRERILVKGVANSTVVAIFREVLLRTPGVATVQDFTAVLDRQMRHLDTSFRATLRDGAIVTAERESFVIG